MNRVIKFRAWQKATKTMFFVKIITMTPEGVFACFLTDEGVSCDVNPDEIILMQFIGRKDKNGTEIYEGEWMKTGYRDDPGSLIGFVEYQIRSARWGIRVGHRLIEFGKRGRWYECLGKNVHQHPDLLKKE